MVLLQIATSNMGIDANGDARPVEWRTKYQCSSVAGAKEDFEDHIFGAAVTIALEVKRMILVDVSEWSQHAFRLSS